MRALRAPFSTAEIEQLAPQESRARNLITTDRTTLHYYPFFASHAIAIVILYHGAGSYATKAYQWVGATLAAHAITAYVPDIRGHGRSQGKRGDAPDSETIWRDIDAMIMLAQYQNPGVPIYLVGHSSSAGMLLNYASWKRNSASSGYIFLAPCFGPFSSTARTLMYPEQHFIRKTNHWVCIINSIWPTPRLLHYPVLYFNHPESMYYDELMIPYYTYTMSCAITPMKPKKQLQSLTHPLALYIGEHDEQLMPNKVLAHVEYARMGNNQSHGAIIPRVGHVSILTQAPDLIANTIISFNKQAIHNH